MPQFAVLIYAPDSAHTADTPAPQTHRAHAEELAASGTMTHAWALSPRDQARTVRASGVTEGPFAEAAEVVAGVYILQAATLADAVATAATNPAVAAGGAVEVRPVHSGGAVQG